MVFDPAITLSELTQESSSCVSMGILKLSSQETLLASVYLEPQLETTAASARLQMVGDAMGRRCPGRALIGSDCNGWSVWWGSPTANERGDMVADFLAQHDLNILNVGCTPTFETLRGTRELASHTDITACGSGLLNMVHGWKVCRDLIPSSDHNPIIFGLGVTGAVCWRLYQALYGQ